MSIEDCPVHGKRDYDLHQETPCPLCDLDEKPYLVCDSWSYRHETEPVMGYFKTRQAAEEYARKRNAAVNADTNGLKRYVVFETQDEGYMQELPHDPL